jgi:flagellar protein FlaG
MTIEVKMNSAAYTTGVVSGLVRDTTSVSPTSMEKSSTLKTNNEAASKVNSSDDAVNKPGSDAEKEEKKPSATEKDIDTAVTDLNSSIQSVQRNLKFSVDKELDKIVINVTDKKTEEVVRQIPSEDFLELARNLQDMMESRDGSSSNKTESFLFSSSA